jgi:hypothetical protein
LKLKASENHNIQQKYLRDVIKIFIFEKYSLLGDKVVCIPQNTVCGCGVTDSGCVATDHWMGRYRPLDAHYILAGTAVAIKKSLRSKSNQSAVSAIRR